MSRPYPWNAYLDERNELKANERKIEASAKAYLDLGTALLEIQIKRLYRERSSTFEAYLEDRWHLTRSVAYQLIDAKKRHDAAKPISYEKLNIEFTAESQLRALRCDSPSDMKAVLQRAAKLTPPDADGVKPPTAKIITRPSETARTI